MRKRSRAAVLSLSMSTALTLLPLPTHAEIDLDGDGMSDVWQIRFGATLVDPAADDDADGFTSLEESRAATDPFDAASRLLLSASSITPDAERITVTWEQQPGKHYGVEASDSPFGDWVEVGAAVTGTGVVQHEIDYTGVPELQGDIAFYRLDVRDVDVDRDGLTAWEELALGYLDESSNSNGGIGGGDFAAAVANFTDDAPFQVAGQTVNGSLPSPADASRFLAQTTMGADYDLIQAVSQTGLSDWLESQFNQPLGLHQPFVDARIAAGEDTFANHRRWSWWEQTMTAPDLVRQRMALALSEIFVISDLSALADTPDGMANYYDMLLQHSFGNFRDLLFDVTMHPCMGVYLSHMKNRKSDPEIGRFPDENYAREAMQLFTIGLYLLDQDGTWQTDEGGAWIPTYTNFEITEFAKVFTGLAFGGPEPHFFWGDWIYTTPMLMFEEQHEPGPKSLLNGEVIPGGQTGMQDINDAVDNLFQHPNVGPFIALRLIQRFVKSNPGPDYIYRVAGAFNDNGAGVRGDMQSVLRAIYFDLEARNLAFLNDPRHGKLREPFLRRVHLARAFEATNQLGTWPISDWDSSSLYGQTPLSSPSVFNFFQPDYQPAGPIANAGLVAPEFQITNSVTAIRTVNELFRTVEYNLNWGDDAEQVELDLTDELAIAADVDALLDRLDLMLTYGRMSPTMRQLIRDQAAQHSNLEQRVEVALYLLAISPEYAVLK